MDSAPSSSFGLPVIIPTLAAVTRRDALPRYPRRDSRGEILDAHDGFVKVVADAKYGEVLGVHIIGPYATEIIAEAVTALELEATVEEMMFTIHAHPTVAEALLDGFSSVEGLAVNV